MIQARFLFTILLLGYANNIAAANKSSVLERRLEKFSARQGAEFRVLCEVIKFPCGWEQIGVNESRGFRKGRLLMHNATIREILDQIVLRNPRYEWAFRAGVLQLLPKKHPRKRKSIISPLDHQADTHSVESDSWKPYLLFLRAGLNVRAENDRYFQAKGLPQLEEALVIRDGLNEMVSSHGSAMWHYKPEKPLPIINVYQWPGQGEVLPDETLLSRRLSGFKGTSLEEFRLLCEEMRQACGIEEVDNHNFRGNPRVKPIKGDATVEEILDRLIQRFPHYRWIVENGVINFLAKPELLRTISRSNPLDRRVESVDADDQSLLAVMQIIKEKVGIRESSGPLAGHEEALRTKITIHLKRKTAREVFNEVARVNGHAMWDFQRGPGEYVRLRFRVW